MPELCCYAECDGRLLPIKEALGIARRGGCRIEYDPERGICSFEHKKSGKFVFPSLENIKATLEALYEYGYMGLSFDIANIPSSFLMMISAISVTMTAIPSHSILMISVTKNNKSTDF
jgi:hypothetical protein